TEQPVHVLIPAQTPSPSQVFPDGGFPPSPSAPEAKRLDLPPPPAAVIPVQAAVPAPTATNPGQQPPSAAYGPVGPPPRAPQDIPGVAEFYHPISNPLPAYFYDPAYYERPVVSPRSVIEYAPPGYETRDQQVTPGTPEFTPIPTPTPVTPEERERFVTRGIF